jgi:predicted nucleic acid-binding Zn ribbon protein
MAYHTHTPCDGANARDEVAKARAATAAAKKVVERSMVGMKGTGGGVVGFVTVCRRSGGASESASCGRGTTSAHFLAGGLSPEHVTVAYLSRIFSLTGRRARGGDRDENESNRINRIE